MRVSFIVGLIGGVLSLLTNVMLLIISGMIPVNLPASEIFPWPIGTLLIAIGATVALCLKSKSNKLEAWFIVGGGITNFCIIPWGLVLNSWLFVIGLVLSAILLIIGAVFRFFGK